MDERTLVRTAAAGTAVLSFIVYLLPLAPTVGFIDSGELAAVAHTFGIAHPTGYPLYSIVAGLWAKLPIGDGIYRLNVLSAVFCSAGAGVLVFVMYSMLGIVRKRGQHSKGKEAQKKGVKPARTNELPVPVRVAVAAFGALFTAFSETYWATALSNEVYPLHILFISLILYFFTKAMFAAEPESRAERNAWLLFALMLGLSFSNHMTTILFAPAFLTVFFIRYKFTPAAWKLILRAIPAFAAGLLPYLYLPLRATSHPFMNWGNPQTWEQFIRHVSGKQYQVWIFSGTDATSRQFSYFFSSFPAEFAYVGIILVAIGIVFAFMRNRRLGGMLALLFAGCVLYSINYDIYDIDSYFLLAYVVAGIWAAFGLALIAQRFLESNIRYTAAAAAVAVGVIIGAQWSGVSERDNYMVEDYTKNMFNSVGKNALVLSFQWDYWVSAAIYYQQVERLRPDVVVLDKELFRRSWYLTHIEKHYPAIYRASQREFREFAAELMKFERDLPYNPAVIETKYNALINSIIDNAYGKRPVYVTIEMEQQFGAGYQRVPEGLAFRLYRAGDVPSLDMKIWDAFTYRTFRRGGRLPDSMKEMYANMLVNRGILYFQALLIDEEKSYFERALVISPESRNAQIWLSRIAQAKGLGSLM